ncbi:hypothetical protein B5G52_04105 [Pseudoalteromonas sp. A601]|nr:hypothetical protein B5G52_04105 [Pseudoalteromonas sp. A601]
MVMLACILIILFIFNKFLTDALEMLGMIIGVMLKVLFWFFQSMDRFVWFMVLFFTVALVITLSLK